MEVKIKKLLNETTIPTRGSEEAAGLDLAAVEDVSIRPGETVKIRTGLAFSIPKGHAGFIFPRSGLATKEGLRLANCVAVIDSDYRGEWMVPIHNDSQSIRVVCFGERFAQVVFLPIDLPELSVVEELDETERGAGGFGSTGK